MAKMPWFRLYSEVLDDKKIKRICRATSFNKATVLGVWVTLLALANESDDRGSLEISAGIPYEVSDIAFETELPDDQVDTLMKLFERYDMLSYDNKKGWHIANWDGRQFKSDNVSERVAKHRERKAQEQVKRYSNVIDTDTDTESEEDTDTENILLSAFCEITELSLPPNSVTYSGWLTEIGNWISMGVTREKIEQAYQKAQDKGYTIVRPQGLTNFIKNLDAEKQKQELDIDAIWADVKK